VAGDEVEEDEEEAAGAVGEEHARQPASSPKATDFMGKTEITTGYETLPALQCSTHPARVWLLTATGQPGRNFVH
jgi:hypothetical protein